MAAPGRTVTMHIPDGYLSPQTCAVLYLTATPFWYVALRRVRRLISTRVLPLISLFAAFSFVIMMFNLPLPGGTTGHAVGVGIASIVLGPWASILAISVAVIIQALFFGDGGITAIGANCFNMAIVGSLIAYGSYRLLALGSGLTSRRRIVAAAVAGYAAINVSALVAAIEFGIQPIFFHDASGTPLYCPYPLSISIPAMMIGHLTFAGLAELLITAGVVAYLQRADPSLLTRTAPGAAPPASEEPGLALSDPFPAIRRLWLVVATLLILAPLGILAAGSAWGEWTAQDFADPAVRQQISAASGNRLPPTRAPQGLERISSLWTAPLPRYAPEFIRNPSFGYIVSGTIGVGVIILALLIANWLLSRLPVSRKPHAHGRISRGFVEKTLTSLSRAVQRSLVAEELARMPGFLQRLDARVKVAGIGALIIAAVSIHRLPVLAALFFLAIVSARAAHVPLRILFVRIWLPALLFSGLVAVPAIFLTAGPVVTRLPVAGWPITKSGLITASLLLLRVETTATLSALLILTTEWMQVLRSLRFFRVPVTAVVILGMTHRYIFLLLKTAAEMFESRRSRLIGTLDGPERLRLAAASVGVLLSKSFQLATEIHSAMRARGFQGEVYILDEMSITGRGWLQLGLFLSVAVLVVVLGR